MRGSIAPTRDDVLGASRFRGIANASACALGMAGVVVLGLLPISRPALTAARFNRPLHFSYQRLWSIPFEILYHVLTSSRARPNREVLPPGGRASTIAEKSTGSLPARSGGAAGFAP
jgi:hypothetical protein